MALHPSSPARNYAAAANQYARDVVSGSIPACEWVRYACRRHLDDLAKIGNPEFPSWPYVFDEGKANRFCRFAELMPHVEGKWKSLTIVLEPWQCFIFCVVFGWVKRDGLRRFRKALVVVPARNSKTTCAAIVALYLLALDGEPGATVACAARNRDQAKLVWGTCHRMVEKTQPLRERFGIQALSHSITIDRTGASLRAVSREAKSLEGLNLSGCIIDEVAASDDRDVFDVLDERTGSRRQPLTWMISTEGDNNVGVFAENVEYGQQILDGRHTDETYFAIYYGCDKGDDWTSPATWRRANPNFGISVSEEDMQARCLRAQKNPVSQASFKTKRLNIRVGAAEGYFNMMKWHAKGVCYHPELSLEQFEHKPCIIGIDFALKSDVTAKIYLFRHKGGYAVFGRYYYPEDQVTPENPNEKLFRGWSVCDPPAMVLTPGNIVDFEWVEEELAMDQEYFKIHMVAYDPAHATEFANRMRKYRGLEMADVPAHWRQLSEPMKLMGTLIEDGKLYHNGDPVLAWMVGNTSAATNFREDVFPRKKRPDNKIDAVSALLCALNRSINLAPKQDSVYERRGMRFL